MAIFPPPPGASTTKVGTVFFISCVDRYLNNIRNKNCLFSR
ncbi:hypothetical protein CHCC15315_1786 [Bacillus licheniformis]|nr:hypothetical protein CHCC15315_1786 [Bacillus licheniformis]TWM82229.1 hypothetical protein CHCC14688_3015 [Bacillus licheniformis]